MKRIGIVKEIDKLGRLVIPKKYRELYGVEERAEIILTDEGILIRKPLSPERSKEEAKQQI